MTAQPQDFIPVGTPLPEKNLRAIRAALIIPEDRKAFDAGLKAVPDEVRVSLDDKIYVHLHAIPAGKRTGPHGAPTPSSSVPDGVLIDHRGLP